MIVSMLILAFSSESDITSALLPFFCIINKYFPVLNSKTSLFALKELMVTYVSTSKVLYCSLRVSSGVYYLLRECFHLFMNLFIDWGSTAAINS